MDFSWLIAWLKPLLAAWEEFRGFLGPFKDALDVLLIASGIAFVLARWFKGWSFLARYHYGGSILGYVLVLRRLGLTIRVNPRGIHTADAARFLTEYEILNPPPPRQGKLFPEKHRGIGPRIRQWFSVRIDRCRKLNLWRLDMTVWRKKRHDELLALVSEKKMTAAQIDAMEPRERKKQYPTITLANPAQIDNSRDEIKTYFEVAKRYGAYEFKSYVQLDYGYLAPLFLINGLMTRFTDQWDPVINNYRKHIRSQSVLSKESLEVQSFEFNCWLLWGPSIPLCDNCPEFQALNSQDSTLYQYGFGDENNSIDVRIPDGRTQALRARIHRLALSDGGSPQIGADVCAVPMSLWGKIRITLDEKQLAPAQQVIRDPKHGRFFIQLPDPAEKATYDIALTQPDTTERKSSNYYSAYIWLMFVILDRDKEPLYTEHSERWKNLLPFFEHGNIADATTMNALKQALVAKACAALKPILKRDEHIIVQYACAFDDSNCGHSLLFSAGDSSLFKMFQEEIDQPGRHPEIKEALGKKLILTPTSKGRPFSACRLPGIVQEFYKAIDTEESQRQKMDWQRDVDQYAPWTSKLRFRLIDKLPVQKID